MILACNLFRLPSGLEPRIASTARLAGEFSPELSLLNFVPSTPPRHRILRPSLDSWNLALFSETAKRMKAGVTLSM
jgi:hypothetical protein